MNHIMCHNMSSQHINIVGQHRHHVRAYKWSHSHRSHPYASSARQHAYMLRPNLISPHPLFHHLAVDASFFPSHSVLCVCTTSSVLCTLAFHSYLTHLTVSLLPAMLAIAIAFFLIVFLLVVSVSCVERAWCCVECPVFTAAHARLRLTHCLVVLVCGVLLVCVHRRRSSVANDIDVDCTHT